MWRVGSLFNPSRPLSPPIPTWPSPTSPTTASTTATIEGQPGSPTLFGCSPIIQSPIISSSISVVCDIYYIYSYLLPNVLWFNQ